ncbi:MAG: hypothetical protein MI784_03635 [Cytophagales bacterium]|nr:hypothetical protein [Cytophagales bacterium]
MTIEEFFASGEKFAGKEVTVTGMVKGVCSKSGKKAFLIGKNPKEVLKVLAGGKIAMFDKSLIGQDITVKGTVLVKKIDKAYLDNWAEELAKTETCEDDKHDHKSAKAEEQTNCSVAYKKYKELKKLVEKSGKGYYPILSLDGLSFEVVEI